MQIFAMSRIEKGKTCQIRRPKGLVLLNIRIRVSNLTTIFGIIMHVVFLIRIFKEIRVTHSQTLMAQEIKNLPTITATMLRIMNIKNQ